MNYDEKLCRMCLQIDCEPKKVPPNVINGLKDIFKIKLLDLKQNLPRHVCTECSNTVSEFYSFYLDSMANQTKLFLGLDKFMLKQCKIPQLSNDESIKSSHPVSGVDNEKSSVDQTSPSIVNNSPISCQDMCEQELEMYENCILENEKQTLLINSAADVNENQSIAIQSDESNEPLSYDTLPDLAHNPNFTPLNAPPVISSQESNLTESYSASNQFDSQETVVSDDITNDPTYTPPESQSGNDDESSSSDDASNVLTTRKTSTINSPNRHSSKYDSDDSDVQITGMISALNNPIKRNMSQASITDFFITKKEKLEPEDDLK